MAIWWGQFVVFWGLLGVCTANLEAVAYEIRPEHVDSSRISLYDRSELGETEQLKRTIGEALGALDSGEFSIYSHINGNVYQLANSTEHKGQIKEYFARTAGKYISTVAWPASQPLDVAIRYEEGYVVIDWMKNAPAYRSEWANQGPRFITRHMKLNNMVPEGLWGELRHIGPYLVSLALLPPLVLKVFDSLVLSEL